MMVLSLNKMTTKNKTKICINFILVLFVLGIFTNIVFSAQISDTIITKSDKPEISITFDEAADLVSYKIVSSSGTQYQLDYNRTDDRNYRLFLLNSNTILNDGDYNLKIVAKDNINNNNSFTIPFTIKTPEITITLLNPLNGISNTANYDFIVFTDKAANCKVSTQDLSYSQMGVFGYESSDLKYHFKQYSFAPGISNYNLFVECKEPTKNKTVRSIFNLKIATDINYVTKPYAMPNQIVSSRDNKTAGIWDLNQNGYCKCSNTNNQNFNNMSEVPIFYDLSTTLNTNFIYSPLQGIYGIIPAYYKESYLYCSQNSKVQYKDTSTGSKVLYEFLIDQSLSSISSTHEVDILLKDDKTIAKISYKDINTNSRMIYVDFNKEIVYPITDYNSATKTFTKNTHKNYYRLSVNSTPQKYATDLQHIKEFAKGIYISDTYPYYNDIFNLPNYKRLFYSNLFQSTYNYYIQCSDLSFSKKTTIEPLTYTSDLSKSNYIEVIEPKKYTSIPTNRMNIEAFTPEFSDCTYRLTYPNTSYEYISSGPLTRNEGIGILGYGYYHSGKEQISLENAQFIEGKYVLEIICSNDESLTVKTNYEFFVDSTPPTNLTISTTNGNILPDKTCQSPDNKWTLFRYNNSLVPIRLSSSDLSGIYAYNFTLLNSEQQILLKKEFIATNNVYESIIDLDANNVILNYSKQYFIKIIAIDNARIASNQEQFNFQTLQFKDELCKEKNPPTVSVVEKQLGGKVEIKLTCQDDTGCKKKTLNNVTYDAIYYRLFLEGDANCQEVESRGDSLLYKNQIDIISNSTICYLAVDEYDNIGRGNKTIKVLPADTDPDTNGIDNNWEREFFGCTNCVIRTDDADNDGLTNFEEYQEQTHPKEIDSDFDGYTDFEEVYFNTDPNDPTSKPTKHYDHDKDGLSDYFELHYFDCRICANPNDDPDKDGLTNLEESQYGTNPNNKDTDSDTYNDKFEIDNGYDPLDPNDHPAFVDDDNDGLPDEWERDNFGNLDYGPNDDPDGDGLINREEYKARTNPNKYDTDGDGWSDYDELITYNTNPLEINDHPTSWFTIILWSVLLILIITAVTFGGLYLYQHYMSKQKIKDEKIPLQMPQQAPRPKPAMGLSPAQLAKLRQKRKPVMQQRPIQKNVQNPTVQQTDEDLSRQYDLEHRQDYFEKRKQNPFDRLKGIGEDEQDGDLFSKLKNFGSKSKSKNVDDDAFNRLRGMSGKKSNTTKIDKDAFGKLKGISGNKSRTVKPEKDAVNKLKKHIKKKYDLNNMK